MIGQTRLAQQSKQNLKQPSRNLTWWQRLLAHPNWFSFIFFVLTTIAFTWPLAANFSNGLFDLGDPADSSWRLGSIAYQLLHDPFHLYQSPTLYPAPNVLTLDELLTGNALVTAPLIWLTNNSILAFNLLVFLSFVLSGFAMYLLVRYLTNSFWAGIVAGIIFAFSPWHYAQHAHLGIGATEWLVLALYFLLLFLDNLSRRRLWYLALFAACFVFQTLAAGYLAYFAAIIVGLFLAYYFLFEANLLRYAYQRFAIFWRKLSKSSQVKAIVQPTWKFLLRQIGWLAVAGIIMLLVVLPFIWPFIQAQKQYNFVRSLDEVRYFSAPPGGLLRVAQASWLRHIHLQIFNLDFSFGKPINERALYPGLIGTLLAAVGLIWAKGQSRRWIFAFIAVFGLVLCFGPNLNLDELGRSPTNIPLPYLWIYDHIPGFDALRVPYRFGAIMMFGLAVCAGYGLTVLQKLNWSRSRLKFKWGAALVGIVAAVVAGIEFYAPGLPMQTVGIGANTPPVYSWLASPASASVVPANAPLLELPMNVAVNTDPLYAFYNLQYRRPLLDGSANILPPGYQRLFNEMADFPDARSLDVISGLQVQFVIVHTSDLTQKQRNDLQIALQAGTNLEIIKNFGDTLLLRLKAPTAFASLIQKIPLGSKVYLGDEAGPEVKRGLYTVALANLLGNRYKYASPYQTMYNSQIQLVQSAQVNAFDFAIVYSYVDNSKLALKPQNLVFSNSIISVYKIEK